MTGGVIAGCVAGLVGICRLWLWIVLLVTVRSFSCRLLFGRSVRIVVAVGFVVLRLVLREFGRVGERRGMTPETRAHLRAQAEHPDARVVSIAAGDLLELLDATEWRPIATAPADERDVDTWCPRRGIVRRIADGDWWRAHVLSGAVPTHWRPLPEPPPGAEGGR